MGRRLASTTLPTQLSTQIQARNLRAIPTNLAHSEADILVLILSFDIPQNEIQPLLQMKGDILDSSAWIECLDARPGFQRFTSS